MRSKGLDEEESRPPFFHKIIRIALAVLGFIVIAALVLAPDYLLLCLLFLHPLVPISLLTWNMPVGYALAVYILALVILISVIILYKSKSDLLGNKKEKLVYIAVLLTLAFFILLGSQGYSPVLKNSFESYYYRPEISGWILDAESGEPVPEVVIRVVDEGEEKVRMAVVDSVTAYPRYRDLICQADGRGSFKIPALVMDRSVTDISRSRGPFPEDGLKITGNWAFGKAEIIENTSRDEAAKQPVNQGDFALFKKLPVYSIPGLTRLIDSRNKLKAEVVQFLVPGFKFLILEKSPGENTFSGKQYLSETVEWLDISRTIRSPDNNRRLFPDSAKEPVRKGKELFVYLEKLKTADDYIEKLGQIDALVGVYEGGFSQGAILDLPSITGDTEKERKFYLTDYDGFLRLFPDHPEAASVFLRRLEIGRNFVTGIDSRERKRRSIKSYYEGCLELIRLYPDSKEAARAKEQLNEEGIDYSDEIKAREQIEKYILTIGF